MATKKRTTTKANETKKLAAPKAVVTATVTPAAPKAAPVEEKAAAPVEKKPVAPVEKKPAAPVEKKPAAPVVKKAAPKKTVRKTTKKTAPKVETYVQFAGIELTEKDVFDRVKKVWTKEMKKKVGDMKAVKLYIKPEENTVYYVINEEYTGKVIL